MTCVVFDTNVTISALLFTDSVPGRAFSGLWNKERLTMEAVRWDGVSLVQLSGATILLFEGV